MYGLIFSARSRTELRNLQGYIEKQSSSTIAANYVRSITSLCESLQHAPHRGEERFYLRPGLRTIGFRRRVSIVFSVSESEGLVRIIRILYAGKQ